MAGRRTPFPRPIGPGLPSGNRRMSRLPGEGVISVTFRSRELIRLVDRYTRSFRSQRFYDALRDANAAAAVKIQKGMYDELQRQIGTHSEYAGPRPQRPGDRLGAAIMDERNAVVYPNGFQVGIDDWLDKSPAALYWRVIEGGMSGYWASALFTDTPGGPWKGFHAPGDGGPHMRMIKFTPGGRIPEVWVRPIKAFEYSKGGRAVYRRLSMGDLYARHLRNAGFKITSANKGDFFK
jgi:hypothetical protein